MLIVSFVESSPLLFFALTCFFFFFRADKVAKILIGHLVHYHDHSWNKESVGNADEWEWKLLNKWDADESDQKLPKDKWNIDTLIGYSKSIHENMNQPAAAGGDATAVASPDTRFQSTSKTGLRSNNK